MDDATAYAAALASAREGMAEGGIPIGASLMVDGKLLAVGRNQRVQLGSSIHHGETNCIENAGRQPASVYARSTIFTTLSPCFMCAGTILLYKIPRVVIGENSNFQASENLLRSHGVELVVLDDIETKTMFKDWIEANPSLWNEDIGED
ncbi:tRNA-specific adenosine deaminase [Actinomycetes bacterium]|nr:tRNA-specific adenosine deaminase [Actinomycetes bacterium]